MTFSEGRAQPEGSSNLSKFDEFCSTFKHYFNVITHKRPDVDGDALTNNDQRDLASNSNSPSKESGVKPSANVEMEASNHKSNTESVSTTFSEIDSNVVTEEAIQNIDVFKD